MSDEDFVLAQGEGDVTVYIPKSELKTIKREVTSIGQENIETGGVLLGRYLPGDEVIIYEATEPGPDADHHRAEFAPDVAHAQNRLDQLRQEWDIHWIGTWHKHPGSLNKPSPGDVRQMRDFVDDQDTLNRITAIIVTVEPSGRIKVNSFHMGPEKTVSRTILSDIEKDANVVQSLAFNNAYESGQPIANSATEDGATTDSRQSGRTTNFEPEDPTLEDTEPTEYSPSTTQPPPDHDPSRLEKSIDELLSLFPSPFTRSGGSSSAEYDLEESEGSKNDSGDPTQESTSTIDDSATPSATGPEDGDTDPSTTITADNRSSSDQPAGSNHSDNYSQNAATASDEASEHSAETIVREAYVDLQRHRSVSELEVRRGEDLIFVEVTVHTGPPIVLVLPFVFPEAEASVAYRDGGLEEFEADVPMAWNDTTTLVDVFEDVLQKSGKHTLVDLD